MKNNEKLKQQIEALAHKRTRPDGTEYRCLLYVDEQILEQQTGQKLLDVECAALDINIVPERYCRNQNSLSNDDQRRLLQAHVAIIGLGGLGGTVTEILARLGIGTLTLVDGDCFDESNLNRQILSKISTLGRSKAETAGERVKEINPATEVRTANEFFTAENSQDILENVQLAIDCLDTIPDRFVLEQSCGRKKIPLVSAAIGGTSGQATAVLPGDPGLQLIYGPPEKASKRGIEATLGTLPFSAMYMAAVQCAEVTNILLGKEPELRHKLFLADIRRHESELVTLAAK